MLQHFLARTIINIRATAATAATTTAEQEIIHQ